MLTIGREGKRQGFETETQEVLSTYMKRVIVRDLKQNQEVLSTYT